MTTEELCKQLKMLCRKGGGQLKAYLSAGREGSFALDAFSLSYNFDVAEGTLFLYSADLQQALAEHKVYKL